MRRFSLIAFALVAGCSGRVDSEAADAGADAITDTASDVASEGAPDVSSQCSTAAEAIARLAVGPLCTSVLRLDYQTLKPIGWNVQCGSGPAPTEAEARKMLAPYTPPYVTSESFTVQPTAPPFPFVFYASPGDFGAIGLVSRRTGVVAFAGGIVWAGRGEIAYPSSWRPASELAGGCAPPTLPPTDRFLPSGELKDATKAALDAAWSTALPLGLSKVNGFGGAFVLGYPRSVGGLDPSSAEWIVVIESALLD